MCRLHPFLLRSFYLRLLAAFIWLALIAGCTKKTAPSQEQKPAPKVAPAADKKQFTEFGAISMAGLLPEQYSAFVKITNEEICPCDCPKTFAGCLQPGTKCEPATILGQWMVDRLREGVPFDMMEEPLAKEIGSGFSGRPQIIDLDEYHTKGAKNPAVTIVEFADFECAHCKATSEVLHELVKKYPQKLKLVYKHFPLPTHKMAKQAAIAVEAAGLQGKFWEMHDALFKSTQPLSDKLILNLAEKVGLTGKKLEEFKTALSRPDVIKKVENSIKEGEMLGLEATPSIFFNGRQYFLSLDMSGFEMRLLMENARAGSSC